MQTPYDDIIRLQHHTSEKYPRMSRLARAAQFAPFAALTGYEDAIKEAARLTDRKIDLDEYEKAVLDRRLRLIRAHLAEQPEITFTRFIPDEKKTGGSCADTTGIVKKIDDREHLVILTDGISIPIESIVEIRGDIFPDDFP